jgi:type III secretory pathway component EscR
MRHNRVAALLYVTFIAMLFVIGVFLLAIGLVGKTCANTICTTFCSNGVCITTCVDQ